MCGEQQQHPTGPAGVITTAAACAWPEAVVLRNRGLQCACLVMLFTLTMLAGLLVASEKH